MAFKRKLYEKTVPDYIRDIAERNEAPLPAHFIPSAEAVDPTQIVFNNLPQLSKQEEQEIETHIDQVLATIDKTDSKS